MEKEVKYKREDFIIKAYSFEIIAKELKEKDKDPKSKRYIAKISLNYNNNSYEGIISFKERKKVFNTFFYDLNFKENLEFFGTCFPPSSIKFTKLEQLKIFNEVLSLQKVRQDEPLSIAVLNDSLSYLRGKKYYFDFYLELLYLYHNQIGLLLILMMFNVVKIWLPEKIEKNLYSKFLEKVENNQNIILKHCSEKDDKKKYIRYSYTLLLFFRLNYEKEKVQALVSNKDLWKYFVLIIPKNYKLFPNLIVSDELIVEMLKQKELTFSYIKGTLMIGGSIVKVLSIINNNCKVIAECCIKAKKR